MTPLERVIGILDPSGLLGRAVDVVSVEHLDFDIACEAAHTYVDCSGPARWVLRSCLPVLLFCDAVVASAMQRLARQPQATCADCGKLASACWSFTPLAKS